MKTKFKLTAMILALAAIALFCCGCEGNTADIQEEEETVALKPLILEPDLSTSADPEQEIDEDALNMIKTQLETRLAVADIKPYTISVDAQQKQIRMELPEEYLTHKVIDPLIARGRLEFRDPNGELVLDNKEIASAYPVESESKDIYSIKINLTDEGTKLFEEATRQFLEQSISVYMDSQMICNPVIHSVISDGTLMITGNFTAEDAAQLAMQINASSLPCAMTIVQGDVK